MHLNSLDSWILKEFGQKRKNSQVRIGNAFQAQIPDLITENLSVNTAKGYDLKSKNDFFKYHIELKSISIHLKKLTGSDIESIKRNLLNQKFKQIAAKKSGLKHREGIKKIFEK